MISCKLATLYELDTIYGTEDLYDMLEILMIDAYNHKLMEDENK